MPSDQTNCKALHGPHYAKITHCQLPIFLEGRKEHAVSTKNKYKII
jgi:hypothetical protein